MVFCGGLGGGGKGQLFEELKLLELARPLLREHLRALVLLILFSSAQYTGRPEGDKADQTWGEIDSGSTGLSAV